MNPHRYHWVLASALVLTGAGLALSARKIHRPTPTVTVAAEFRLLQARTPKAEQQVLFARFLPTLGAEKILDVLEATYPLCHSQAHPLGMAVYAKTNDLNAAIATCRERCTSGCFHGILMEAFRADNEAVTPHPEDEEDEQVHVELPELKRKIQEICYSEQTQTIHRLGNCAHGIGHAIAVLSGYRLDEALAACTVFDRKPLQYYCAGGVFMERNLVYGNQDATNASVYFPCDAHTQFPAACYRYKAKHLLRRLGGRPQLAAACASLTGYERLGCFHGLGFAHLDQVATDPELLADVCQYGAADDQTVCIEGAIEKLADYDATRANAACRRLPDTTRQSCTAAISWGIYSLEKPFTRYFPDR